MYIKLCDNKKTFGFKTKSDNTTYLIIYFKYSHREW